MFFLGGLRQCRPAVRALCYSTETKPLFPTQCIREIMSEETPKENVVLRAWVKSVRLQKNICFASVNDGTSPRGMQVVLNITDAEKLTPGACVEFCGTITESLGKKQSNELISMKTTVLGPSSKAYPLQNKHHTNEFLREIGHLRSRGNIGSATLRIRHAASQGFHQFFANHNFTMVNTPILTSHDCEGAGEVFQVSPKGAQKDDAFFKKPVYLTVSGQLHAEMMASALSRVYTLGPVFRAEASVTSRHLAEFWMLEAEMAFVDNVDQLLDVTEASIKHTIRHVLAKCPDDVSLFASWVEKNIIHRLNTVLEKPFKRITYTEAIEILLKARKERKISADFPVVWGNSLPAEHERYLCSTYYNSPLFVTDYPEAIKPFYMRAHEDGKTVGCFDLLMPGVGELVGGSMREEREDVLRSAMEKAQMKTKDYEWYLDLRKYGSAPHGGFGLGFERFIVWITGQENVKDVVPVPRWVGHCKY
ncbi:asparaginyl-tRNA synthetase [Spinellus fusiger]|nr:asparaginyl-tRNA synthetase [Spinellus fusiger]